MKKNICIIHWKRKKGMLRKELKNVEILLKNITRSEFLYDIN